MMVANLEIKLLKTSSSNSSTASSIISPPTDSNSSSTNNAQPLANGGFSKSDSSFADRPSSPDSNASAKAQHSAPAVLSSATNLLIQEFLRKAVAGPQSTAVPNSDSDSSAALWDGFCDLFALSVTKSESSNTSSTWDGIRDLLATSIEPLPKTPGGGGSSAINANDGSSPQTQTDSTDSSTSTNMVSSSMATTSTTTHGGGRTNNNNNNHQNKALDELTDLSIFSSETLLAMLSNVMVDLLKSQHEVKEKVSCEAQYSGIGKVSSTPIADSASSSSGAGMSTILSSRSAVGGNNRKNTNFSYEALDKLELRYAIAKAADFYEFVRIYSAGGAEPTLSQIVRIAELLFKDYQHHVLHHEILSNA